MDERDLEGSHYEMGRQYGELLKRVGFTPPPVSQATLEFVAECRPIASDHVPNLLRELEGVAEGGGFDTDRIDALALALGEEPGCSVVAVSGDHTAEGNTLFGRNYDYYRSFGAYSELYRTHPENGLAHVGCSDHWVGRHDGINEAGLAVGHTFVPNRGSEPGVMFALAARAVLDDCATVPEAIDFLGAVPHARNTNFLIADTKGAIAVVEASPNEVTITRPDGFGAVTNHFFSERMRTHESTGDERPEDENRANSERRLSALREWFDERQGIDVEGLKRTLADPETGVCACAEGGESNDDPIETLWSWVATLDGPDASLARGRPDNEPYELVAF